MRRRDVGIGIAVGLAIVASNVIFGSGTSHPISYFIERSLFNFWPVGVAALAAAVILQVLHRWPRLGRAVGMVGIAWITFIVGYDLLLGLLLLLIVAFGGGIGP